MNIREILAIAPVIPVITIERLEHAIPLARALVAGGLRVLEITLRTAVSMAAMEKMRGAVPEAIVGVGTLTRAEEFARAARAGAQFGVSPGLTAQLIEASRDVDFPLLPGVMTPTELIAARNAGFDSLKLFPAQQAGGIEMLKSLGAPFPDILFCPTGGISRQTAPAYLALKNVACIGGSWVAPRALMDAGEWGQIEALAADAAQLRT